MWCPRTSSATAISPMPDGRSFGDLHARLVANLRLAMNVFINNDVNDAEKLLAEKVKFRELELVNYDKHLVRLADHTVQSIETSSLHLDLMRDLQAHQLALLLGGLSHPGSRRRPVGEPAAGGGT